MLLSLRQATLSMKECGIASCASIRHAQLAVVRPDQEIQATNMCIGTCRAGLAINAVLCEADPMKAVAEAHVSTPTCSIVHLRACPKTQQEVCVRSQWGVVSFTDRANGRHRSKWFNVMAMQACRNMYLRVCPNGQQEVCMCSQLGTVSFIVRAMGDAAQRCRMYAAQKRANVMILQARRRWTDKAVRFG